MYIDPSRAYEETWPDKYWKRLITFQDNLVTFTYYHHNERSELNVVELRIPEAKQYAHWRLAELDCADLTREFNLWEELVTSLIKQPATKDKDDEQIFLSGVLFKSIVNNYFRLYNTAKGNSANNLKLPKQQGLRNVHNHLKDWRNEFIAHRDTRTNKFQDGKVVIPIPKQQDQMLDYVDEIQRSFQRSDLIKDIASLIINFEEQIKANVEKSQRHLVTIINQINAIRLFNLQSQSGDQKRIVLSKSDLNSLVHRE